MPDFRLIDYDHSRDDVRCSGVVSDLDGDPEAVWTLDAPAGVEEGVWTVARPLGAAAFAALWEGIEASLARRGVFWRHLVADPTRPLDPEAGHLIVAACERDGRRRHLTFMVPADEADPEFEAWLDALAVPAAAPPRAVAAE